MLLEIMKPSLEKVGSKIELIEIIDKYGKVHQTMKPTNNFDYFVYATELYNYLVDCGFYIRFRLPYKDVLMIKDGKKYVFCCKDGTVDSRWVQLYWEGRYRNGEPSRLHTQQAQRA